MIIIIIIMFINGAINCHQFKRYDVKGVQISVIEYVKRW